MQPYRSFLLGALLALAPASASAVSATITVTQDLTIARPAETITVPWTEINRVLPGALLQHIAVKDAAGHVLPHQVTNVAPEAKDPKGIGIAYGDLIFQHDFAAGEKSATFTVETIEDVAPVFPTQAFVRLVPERLDDIAWENDRIAHRTYGPALAAPAAPGSDKEVLVTSGLDVWCKRVAYPIVDRWYNKGHDHYHKDEGEGMDMYQVGPSRGCGGTGIWIDKHLYVSGNYQSCGIIANGPIRAIFELTYDTWAADRVFVTEVKRFTVDAGHNLDVIESTFTIVGTREVTVGIGLNENPADRGQNPEIAVTPTEDDGSLTQWVVQKTNGALGTAIAVPSDAFRGFSADDRNLLILASAVTGQPLRYLAGAGWDRSGQFADQAAWQSYVNDAVARERSPVKVKVTP